ncbi:MAG: hypothetical protein A3A98_02825 [Candidatus Staskawiczbacteria bacterium RIFCSPLOWO2_01_FULL_40_39]|uniref:Uncharacterized protein n=1 Tax=Candidatus Staskawiczbacteria bacterium RIFCSPHIGHO2_01_FULL_39_25 TaxID=1802202 RepID=A0A1G2HM85_9BACT|nr:MAG: hypothetical protein A2730_03595 [Candidatus Staskawiczbacteria bacterium RIFCSPHIGHO2_01_FULL_39_25]OGZ73681.1 MAG: hypothetical protein A3A98_02825 [Candidatus Staskawiczbacteria bacterium RIFCSPLOWO2_01_FULL_40_39]
MKIVKESIEISELKEMMARMSGVFVKAVVDIEKEIMAVDAELHADLMEFLIEKEASEPKNIWGVNIYPEKAGEDFIEFDSMVNIKPGLGNRTRSVDSLQMQEKIRGIIKKLIP